MTVPQRWQRVRQLLSGRAGLWPPVAAVGGLVIALLLGVAVVVEVVSTDSDRAATTTAGAEGLAVLHQAADALESVAPNAIQQPSADQWMYRKTESDYLVEGERVSEVWISVDDHAKHATRNAEGQIEIQPQRLEDGPSSSPLYDDVRGLYQLYEELPEETDQLVQAIYDLTDKRFQAACDDTESSCPDPAKRDTTERDQAAFDTAFTLLSSGAPPAFQADLYRSLTKIPGVENDGMVNDSTGREAIAIGCDQGAEDGINTRRQILLDPDSYTYRGNRVLDYDIEHGGPLLQSTTVTWAIVDQPGQTP